MFRMPGGDRVAERSREAFLEDADLLLCGAGLLFGGFHLDAQRGSGERGLTAEPGDEARLDLGLGVGEPGGDRPRLTRHVGGTALARLGPAAKRYARIDRRLVVAERVFPALTLLVIARSW